MFKPRASNQILISACLLAIPCQYNGQLAILRLEQAWLKKLGNRLIPVCPEQLAGLPTPRKPIEIQGGDGRDVLSNQARVISDDKEDFTDRLIQGAKNVLEIARVTGANQMIVQDRSPSCSCVEIYDGTFEHVRKRGYGVCAAFLEQNQIELIDIKQLPGLKKGG